MSFTLGFFASVCVLLPGLVAVAAFNQKSGLAGVRRPEQPLTSVRTLVISICLSLLVHFLAFMIVELALALARDLGSAWQERIWGPTIRNPITALFELVSDERALDGPTAFALCAVFVLEVFAVIGFVSRDPFDLLVEPLDLGGHGWLFQHVIRPAENGYLPFGHVFTTTGDDGFGLAYMGPIVDIRQGADGAVLSVALARPERFVYKVGDVPADQPWRLNMGRSEDQQTSYRRYDKEAVGGVVAIAGNHIANISVHNVSKALIEEYAGEEGGED